ncbi:MAG: glutamine amidotransferase [Alphaproteobacteria bacterium]
MSEGIKPRQSTPGRVGNSEIVATGTASSIPSKRAPATPGKILIILHQETSTPGRVGMKLVERDYRLDIRRPRFGDKLPTNMDDHDAAVIFGGPMSANDADDFITQEIDWISVPLAQDKPFLGLCLGAQMLSMHLGGTVGPPDNGQVEIGYYPLQSTDDGRQLMAWPAQVYQWHVEDFSLPGGASLLAQGVDGRNQAMRVGTNAYGVQFHPELTLAMLHRWVVRGAHRFTLAGAQQRRQHLEGRRRYDHDINAWLDRFLDLWLVEH